MFVIKFGFLFLFLCSGVFLFFLKILTYIFFFC